MEGERKSTRRGKFMPGLCSVYVRSPPPAVCAAHTVPGGSASECHRSFPSTPCRARPHSPPRWLGALRQIFRPCPYRDYAPISPYARLDCIAQRCCAPRVRRFVSPFPLSFVLPSVSSHFPRDSFENSKNLRSTMYDRIDFLAPWS